MTSITEQAKAAEESDGKRILTPHQILATSKKSNSLGNKRFLKNHGGD